MKKIKKFLIAVVIIFIFLYNPISGPFFRIIFSGFWQHRITWFLYKDNIEKYVYNSDKFEILDPSFCCMTQALDLFESYTNDSVVVDSMLIVLLSFRDKNGDIRCNDIHQATISHILCTHRYHMLPYVEQLRDSFDSYPTDIIFDTEMSYGTIKRNTNIKNEINHYIEFFK